MDTLARRMTTKLSDLPAEIIETIAVVQPPKTLCAMKIALPNNLVGDDKVWSRVCERSFDTRVTVKDTAQALAIARSLTCSWWAACGALVRGVPVHFRRGFITVRERGATTLAQIRSSSNEAALVMSGPDELYGAHSPPAALECDFALNAQGPFPNDGMVVRITGAPVPTKTNSPPSSPLARSPTSRSQWSPLHRQIIYAPRLPPASMLRAEGRKSMDESETAVIRIIVNGNMIGLKSFEEMCVFSSVDMHIPSKYLRRKPSMNTITIEYVNESSNSALWLREVRVVAAVLPLDAPPKFENVPLRHVGRSIRDQFGNSDKLKCRPADFAYPCFSRMRGC